jgi:hypothetical protein
MSTTPSAIGTLACSLTSCCRRYTTTTKSKKGYDLNYSWRIGVHSHDMGGAMLPETMRWLWRDQLVSLDPHNETERSFRKAAQ